MKKETIHKLFSIFNIGFIIMNLTLSRNIIPNWWLNAIIFTLLFFFFFIIVRILVEIDATFFFRINYLRLMKKVKLWTIINYSVSLILLIFILYNSDQRSGVLEYVNGSYLINNHGEIISKISKNEYQYLLRREKLEVISMLFLAFSFVQIFYLLKSPLSNTKRKL